MLRIVEILLRYGFRDFASLCSYENHPFLSKNMIFGKNLWSFENFFSLKRKRIEFSIRMTRLNIIQTFSSKIGRFHQIQPTYTPSIIVIAVENIWPAKIDFYDSEEYSV